MPTISAMNEEIERLSKEVQEAKERLREAQKRAEPQPVEDWELRTTDGGPVRLSELFGDKDDLLVAHNMGKGCSYCTLWADGFRGFKDHLENRAAFVLCSDDEPATVKEFAASRDWNFRCVSGAGSDFKAAMNMADEKGKPWPGVSAFKKKPDGSIVRTGFAYFGPGDDFCAVWPMFDLFQGEPDDWSPKYSYA